MYPRSRRRAFLAVLLRFGVFPLAPAAALAQSTLVSPADEAAVRRVIQAQFDAFAADDAKAAFAFATSALRELFGTPERFMALVRANYPAVYRHADTRFLKPAWVAGVLVQEVHITDSNGALWLAIYQLEPQSDRSWRIGGCQIARTKGVST